MAHNALSDVFELLGADTVSVRRRAAGSYNPATGEYAPAADQVVSLTAHIQPASPRQMLALPEGQRTAETLVVFSGSELRAASSPGGADGDVLTWRGEEFAVISVEQWKEMGDFYKALAQRRDQEAGT